MRALLAGTERARGWDGVEPIAAPRMAPRESLQAEQTAAPRTVNVHGFGKITGARWLIPATATGTDEKRKHW